MIRGLTAVALTIVVMAMPAAPARADEQSYLDYLETHDFQYEKIPGASTSAGVIRFGEIICDNVRHGRPPRDRFDKTIADSIGQVMIDGAQRELCPDTVAAGAPPPEVSATPAAPPPPEAPPPLGAGAAAGATTPPGCRADRREHASRLSRDQRRRTGTRGFSPRHG